MLKQWEAVMGCPECKSEDTMTTSAVRTSVPLLCPTWLLGKKVELTVTHKCLDCGHEWEGEE